MSLSSKSETQSVLPKWLTISWLVVSALGFTDATYLTAKHYQGEIPECSLVHGCDAVLTSQFATIGPVPLALTGAIYYLLAFLLMFAYLDGGKLKVAKMATGLSFIGFGVSAVLVYLQAFVIQAWCQFCLASAVTSTLLFALGLVILKQRQGAPQAGFVAK